MPKFIDRTGQRFNRLLVLDCVGRNLLKKVIWRCLCDCGKETTVTAGSFVTGTTTSCGCYLKEKITKHGGSGKGSYNTWRAMMRRCYRPNDKDYPRYGGQGVIVCSEWHEYMAFAVCVGEPLGTETLDRIDPYGDYTPKNCRWATLPTQARNTRVRKTTESGVTGVLKVHNGKWMAKITAGKKAFYSKVFCTVAEAATARKELEQLHWGHA